MLNKLRRAIRAGRSTAQPPERDIRARDIPDRNVRERKIRFEALESRFLLSADIAIPPPDPHQDGNYDHELEQTQISQPLVLEEQQQVRILELDPTLTAAGGTADDSASGQEPAEATAPNDDAANTETAVASQTGADDTDGDQADADSSVVDEGTNGDTAAADQADTSAAADSDTGDGADATDTSGTAVDGGDTASPIASGESDRSTTAVTSPTDSVVPPPLLAQQPREIIFVDPAVNDYHALIDELLATSHQQAQASSNTAAADADDPARVTVSPSPDSVTDGSQTDLLSSSDDSTPVWQQSENLPANSTVIDDNTLLVVLDAGRDGIDQISDVLQAYQGVAAVHILSHGSSAALRLGNSSLTSEKLKQYADRLKAWGRALTPDGDILLYGCNVGNGGTGVQFVQNLGELTGADIAASNDDTGNTALGGDWQLEVSTGIIDASSLFGSAPADFYGYLLDNVFIPGTDVTDPNTNGNDDFTITADSVQVGVNAAVPFAPGDDVAVNAADITDTSGTTGNDTFAVDAFPEAQASGSDPGNYHFNVYGGEGSDTLDFSTLDADLYFAFLNTTDFGKVGVTDNAHELAAANIETISGGLQQNTFDFSAITADLTFTFRSSGDITVDLYSDPATIADSIVLENAANSDITLRGGQGNNNYLFEPGTLFTTRLESGVGGNNTYKFQTGTQFTGEIDGTNSLNDTLDFSASTDLLTFVGDTISHGTELNFTHQGIDNIDVAPEYIDITGIVQQKLKDGLGGLVGDWAVDVQNDLGLFKQALAGLDANGDVTLGKALQITEALDQLRLDIKNLVDDPANTTITAKDIADRISAFAQSNIDYFARTIGGDVFNPAIGTGSYDFAISLDGGAAIDITAQGNNDLNTFVANINAVLDANPSLQGKVKAVVVTNANDSATTTDDKSRIAFQVTASDIDSFTLSMTNETQRDLLGFAATKTISGLKDVVEKLGALSVDVTGNAAADLNVVNGLPELVFNFELVASRSSDFGIKLGKGADDIGLTFGADAKMQVNAGLTASLGLGLRLNDNSSASDFFFNLPNLSVEAKADGAFGAGGIASDVRIGFLAATVSGDMHLDAKASTHTLNHSVTSMTVDTDAMPVNADIKDLDLNLSVAVNVNGLDTGLATGLGSFNKADGDPDQLTIKKTDGDPFQGSDVEGVDYTNFDKLGLFGSFNAASFVAQVGTVRDWFGSVRDSDIFKSIDIPFVTPTLDKVFNLGDTVGDALLYDQGGDGKDDGTTLVVDVRTALADAGLDKKLRVEGDGTKLTLLATDQTLSAITVTLGTALGFDEGQTADRDPDTHRLELTAANTLSSPVLNADTTIKITLVEDGQAKEYFVKVGKDATANNATLGNDHAKLLDENNVATFETTQDLANKLLEIIGIDDHVIANYDATSKRLTFALTFNPAQFELQVPVDFNFDLSPIGNIGTVGSPSITLGAGVDIELTLGLDLSDNPAGGGKDLKNDTKLLDLDSIDTLADAINTEYSLAPAHLPLSSGGQPGQVSNADLSNGDLSKANLVFIDSGAGMTGSPKLTFSDVGDADTIERSDGAKWVSDGFAVNQQITISGTASNNGTFTIQDIQGSKLTLSANDKLKTEEKSGAKVTGAAPTLSGNPDLDFTVDGKIFRSAGDWEADGFAAGQYITVEGAGVNSGTYFIDKIDTVALTLNGMTGSAASFDAKTDVKNVSVTVPDRIRLTPTGGADPDSVLDLRSQFWSGQLLTVTGSQFNNRSVLIADLVQTGTDAGKVLILSAASKVSNETVESDDTDIKLSGGPIVRLSDDATFFIDGTAVTVLAKPAGPNSFVGDTSDNNNLLDLVNDINSSLDQAGLKNRIKAVLNNGQLQLTARTELTGNPVLSFSTTENTITRDEGSWTEDGFAVDQIIRLSGTTNNDDIAYVISSVSDTVLTLAPAKVLKAETASRDITIRGTYAFQLTTSAGNPARGQLGFADSQGANSTDLVITLTDGTQYDIVLDSLLDDVVADPPTIAKVIDAIETQTGHQVKAEVDPDSNAGLRLVQVPSLTGNPRVSFDSTDNRIIREDGKLWSDDGFVKDQLIRVSGADDSNDGIYQIVDISKNPDGKDTLKVAGPSGTLYTINKSQTSIKDVRITLAGDEIFRVAAANGSKIAGKLGILKADVATDVDDNGKIEAADGDGIIEGDAVAGSSVLDRFFILDPTVTGGVYVRTGDTSYTGSDGLDYLSANSFTLSGDLSSDFEVGARLTATLGDGSQVTAKIANISYDGSKTTFTVSKDVLDATLASVAMPKNDGITVRGDFGLVSIDLNGYGELDTRLTLGLEDPTPDVAGITINEIIKSLSHLSSIVATPTIGGAKVSGEKLKFDGKTIIRTETDPITGTAKVWGGDFAVGEYISVTGSTKEGNDGHYKITKVEGNILTVDRDTDFVADDPADAKNSASVLDEIGVFKLSLDVNPTFGLINESAADTTVALFDFGNPFADFDFKKMPTTSPKPASNEFKQGDDEKSFTVGGDWTDRIKVGNSVEAELSAVVYDNGDADTGNDFTKLSESSFSLNGDLRGKYQLGSKVTAERSDTSTVTSKIRAVNYDESTSKTTILLEDKVLGDTATATVSKISISNKAAVALVAKVSYDDQDKVTTVTLINKALSSEVLSLTVNTPRGPDVMFKLPDLGDLVKFDSLDISQIIDGLIALSDFLGDYEAFGFLSEPIPVINISVNDVLSFADRFDAAVQQAKANPAGTLQVLEDKLKEALGIPAGSDADAVGFTARHSATDGVLLGDEAISDSDVAGMNKDTVFLLALNGGPAQLIKVAHTDSNGDQIDTVDELVANVNTALSAAFGTKVHAERENNRVKFTTEGNKSLAISNPIDFSIFVDDKGNTDPNDDLQMLRMDFGLGVGFSKGLDVSFDLGGDTGILSGAAGLEASGAIDFNLSLGIDLNNPGDFYMFDSDVTGQLQASGNDLAFRAGIGPLGVFINDGSARIGGNIGNDSSKLFTFGLDFDDNPDVEAYKLIGDIDLSNDFTAQLAGGISVDLPVYFPTETLHKGSVVWNTELALDGNGDLTTTTELGARDAQGSSTKPDGSAFTVSDLFTFDLNELSLMDNMRLAVDGLDAFLGGLQDVLDGEVFGVPMPLIGDKLTDGARFIEDLRADFISPFRDGIENMADQQQNVVSHMLFDLLGPAGLGLLKDTNGNGVDINDITLDTNVDVEDGDLNNDYMQWNMVLGQNLNLGTGIGLDLGIPGLGLETKGDVNIDLGWQLDFGFGISFEDAFYLDISDDSELEVNLDVALPDFGLTGKLGFLQLDAIGNNDPVTGDPLTHFGAKFGVNVVNKKDSTDQRLAFSELGDIGLEAGVAGEAVADLHLAVKLDSDLAPGLSGVFPKVTTDFRLDWSIDGDDTMPGLQLKPFSELKGTSATNLVKSGLNDVKFEHVSLDLGSFVTDFINPILGSVRDVTEPLQPIIDFLTTPLPVISDLGPSLTVLDIARMTGKVNTGFIESVADLITFINALPTDAGSLLLDFGDFSIFDKTVNPDLDITNPTEDVQNKVAVPQDRTGTEADTGNDTAKKNTKSFTDKLKSAGDFDFPIINDPTQIFNLLLGKDAVLMTYDLKPLVAEFSYKQSFPVYPPLFVAILGQISAEADFAFGFDTSGIKEFADSGFRNPALIFDGFFISDTNLPTGEFGTDVPELTLSGFLGAAAELNLGIASGGVGGGVGLNVFFDLFDPNHDGKVRIPEMVNSIVNEFRYGSPALAPMALFDVSGDVYAKLFAYIKFLFFSYDFDITPPITLLDFNVPFTRAPTLATDIGDGVLQLNMGEFASQRLNNNTVDGDETFIVSGGTNGSVTVQATFGGDTFIQTYDGVTKILALAGEGNDTIDLTGLNSNSITFELDGGVGNDRILLSSDAQGKAVIHGGVGDDVIVGGGGGDEIYGDAGNDNIKGNGGNDVIFGDEGEIAYLDNGDVDYTRARIRVTDGDDVIDGGANDDMIFGGGGKDDIQGGDGNDLIIGDGAILREKLTIVASKDVAGYELSDDAALEIMIDGESFRVTLLAADTTGNGGIDELIKDINDQLASDDLADRLTAGHDGDRITFTASDGVLDLRVKGANETATSTLGFTPFFKKALVLDDTNRGDGRADTLRGGAGDDVIYAGRGDDTLYGNDGNDELFGDDGFDLLYGNAGNDRLFGGADNDRISGGAGDDHIEGDAGHDRLWGDWMVDETVSGAAGNDSIWGGIGSDTIFGGAGDDFLFGDSDPDAIFGEEGNDTIDGGQGADQVFGGIGDDTITSSLGDDLIDGGSGSDDVTVNTLGGDMHSLLTVFDSGAPVGDGTDTLIVNGTAEADRFLLRAARADVFDATLIDVNASLADLEARLADMGVAKNLQFNLATLPARAFIAKLNNDDKAERINYYDNLESIIVNTLDGADFVVSDNTNAEVTINGGDGNDLFQIGQLFNSPRDTDAGIDPYDVFDTVQTTKGFLSSGINAPMTINGEDGNDSFVVFRNLKVLTLNGGDGDDEFLVKAFALEGSVDDPDRDLTDITGAGGADLIQYAVNAPVGINGGDGLDTVIVLGTEFGDDFVVTDQGVYGAGLNVNFAGIEVLKLDAAEGNDRIFVLGTGADHITEIFAGEGSDAFFIAGDTPPIVSQDLLGHSGIITQQASSGDARFDGVNVDGISANVGDNDEPFVRIIKNDGLLRVTEDGLLVASYSLVLTREPRATVGITAIAPRPSPNEERNGVQYIKVNGAQAAEVIFDKSNWFVPQTITVTAINDLAFEGDQVATINHLVGEYQVARDASGNIVLDADGKPVITPVSDSPTYNGMAIPSVNVEVIDNDLPGLVIQQSDGDTRVIEGAAFGAPAPFADDYTVRLNQQPTSSVTVTLINEDGQLQLEQTTLTFTPADWNIPQTVRVIATDDAVKEGFHYGYIKHVVSSAQTDVTLATTDTFAATGIAPARSSVLLNYAPIDKSAISAVQVGTETLTPDRYRIDAKQLTLLDRDGQPDAVTDAIVVSYSYIKPGFQNVAAETLGVAIGDNDAPGVLVMQSGGSTNVIEVDDATPGATGAPFTDQYQVVLTAKPNANVVIDVAPQATKTSGRPPFVFSADVDNVAVTELGFTESSDPTISLTSGQPAPEDGRLSGDLVFDIDLTPDDNSDAAVPVTLSQADMAGNQSIDDLISGINTALKDAGLADKIFATRDENRVVIAKVAEPQRQQVDVSTSQLIFTPNNWNIPQTVVVRAINDNVVDGGDIKAFAPVEHTVARIQGPLIINGGGGQGSDAGLGADPLRMPGESNDVGNVVEIPTDTAGNVLANQVVLNGKDIDKLGPSYFKSLDTFQPGDEHNDAKAKVIIKITSGPGEGQERVVVARNGDTFVLAEDWDTADLPSDESRYIFIRQLGKVDEAQQVDVATVFQDGSVADTTGTLTATRLYGMGMGPDMQMDGLTWPGGLTYSNLENLTIHMGPGDDTLDIYGAQNRDDFRTVTIVNTGAGNDDVTVDIEAGDGVVANGVVTASRSQHLRSSSDSFPTDGRGLSGYVVRVTDADGKVQERTILFNDGDTLYVDRAWVNLPQVGDHFEIIRHPSGLLSINTQAGNDRIDGSASTAPLIAFGGLGADQLFGGLGDDILIGDQGQIDYIDRDGKVVTRLGSDDIPAPRQANPDDPDNPIVIFRQTDGVFRDPSFIRSVNPASGGNDEIHGGRGDDLLIGGAMADRLFGDEGNDVLIGDGGQKVVLGAGRAYFETIDNFIGGNDTLDGGAGSDILFGGFGNDALVGNFRDDIILGEYGRATVADGKVEFLLRLGQGALDLAASTWFSLYGIEPYAIQAVPVPGEAGSALLAAAPATPAPVTISEETRGESHYSTPEGLPPPGSIPPEYHVVEQNNTLWYLADIYLGDPTRWPEIWALNPEIKNPDLIFPGMKIKLPQPATKGDAAPEDDTLPGDTAPSIPDANAQDTEGTPVNRIGDGQLALSGLGLLGLGSLRRPRPAHRSALHSQPDGTFVFDQLSSQLRPYYPGGRPSANGADSNYEAVALEDVVFMESLTDLPPVAAGERPIIDWETSYASRPN